MNDNTSMCVMCSSKLEDGNTTQWNKHAEPICEDCNNGYAQNLKGLTGNQYWLLEHQITAFWHGFGISNGLTVPKGMVEQDKKDVHISSAFMREVLQKYVAWLKSYKEKWSSADKHPYDVTTFEGFLQQEECDKSREPILQMISLLQDSKGDAK